MVIRTHVTLISPGTELANWQGKLHMNTDAPRWYPMDSVGYANVGEVVAAGSEIDVKPGQRVYAWATTPRSSALTRAIGSVCRSLTS